MKFFMVEVDIFMHSYLWVPLVDTPCLWLIGTSEKYCGVSFDEIKPLVSAIIEIMFYQGGLGGQGYVLRSIFCSSV